MKEPPSADDRFRHFFDYDIWLIPGSILDRLLHLHGQDFSYAEFLQIYCEIETGLLWDELPFTILVPIALTAFEDNAPMKLSPDVGLIQISDALQLARVKNLGSPTTPANEVVVGAATHAAVFTGWKMPNYSGYGFKPYEKPGWFPTSLIDSFFDALRVVTGLDTGYAQIIMLPSADWAFPPFDGTLPPVVPGPEVRKYPLHFDDFGWLKERQPVTRSQLEEVSEIYHTISKRKSLQLGAARLSASMLREIEDDKILDLLIGLEACLGDDGRSEMTHKLALRTAAVLAHADGRNPEETFKHVKHLYDYRSAVAHGDEERAAKRREIETSEGMAFSSEVATTYLRIVIRALSRSNALRTGREIDFSLILAGLRKVQSVSDPSNEEGPDPVQG